MAEDNNTKLDFSDLGAVPVQKEEAPKALDFSDLGAEPVQSEGQQLREVADNELEGFKNMPKEFLTQMFNQATRSIRIANQLRTQQATSLLPIEAQQLVQAEELKLQESVPLLLQEREAQGFAGTAGNIVGSFLDPVVALSGGIGTKVAEVTAKRLLINQAEKAAADAALYEAKFQINRVAADQAVKKLAQQNLIKNTAAGAGGGFSGGLTTGLLDVKDQNLTGMEAIEHVAKTTVGGTVAGTAFGAAHAHLGPNRQLRKQAAEIPEGLNVVNSPAKAEAAAHLEQLVLERAKLQSELEATQKLAGPLDSAKVHKKLSDSYQKAPEALADHAAQRAALVEEVATSRSAAIQETRAQQVARLQSEIDVDQAALETLKIDPRPIEERFAAQQQLEKRIANRQKMQQELGSLVEKEQASLQIERQTRLNEISDSLDSRLNNLHTERQKLLSRLQSKLTSADKIEELQGALRANLEQQAKLTDVQRQFGFRGAKNPKSQFAVNQAIDIAQQQYDKTHAYFKNLGMFTDDQVQRLAELEFKNAIELQGVKTSLVKPRAFEELSNDVERFSKMGSLTGTNTGEVVLKSLFAENELANTIEPALAQWNAQTAQLRSRGWTNEQITKTLQYIERNGFNPSAKASKALTREAWPLDVPPSAEDLNILYALRQQLDADHASAVQFGLLKPDQFVDGYVPILKKNGAPPTTKSAKGLMSPSSTKERVEGKLDGLEDELDIDQLYLRYKKQVAQAQIYAPVVREGVRELVKLQLLGQTHAHDVFEKYLLDTFRISGGDNLKKTFGHMAVEAQVNRLAEAGLPEGAITQIYEAASENMYKTVVASNPKNWVMQFVQPEFLLPAEVGVGQYTAARAKALSGRNKEVQHLLKYVIKGDLPATEELMTKNLTNPVARLIKGSGDLTDTLKFTAPFKLGEKLNRYTALIAGRDKFLNSLNSGGYSGVRDAISNFLPAEQAFIEKAFRQGGKNAGADAMAIIVDRRANFSYGRGDRTEALRNLSKYVPFTTFYRNIIARYQGDIQNGNYTQLAKRLSLPIAAATFFESLTDKDFSESTLDAQAKRLVGGQTVAPVFLGPAKTYYDTRSVAKTLAKELPKLTPVGPLMRAYENNKKHGNPFGLKPVPKDAWSRKLIP
jgi:hypothetical protein